MSVNSITDLYKYSEQAAELVAKNDWFLYQRYFHMIICIRMRPM